MNSKKLNSKFIRNILIGTVIFCVSIVPFFFIKDNLYVIYSNSMAPTLNTGDLVYVSVRNSADIKVGEKNGDILIIRGPNYYYENNVDPILLNYLQNNTPIIHRGIDKKIINNTYYFLMKGDNNRFVDGGYNLINDSLDDKHFIIEYNYSEAIYVIEDEVIGVVQFTIPYLGYIKLLFPYILITIGIVVLISLSLKLSGFQIKIIRAHA